MDELLKLMSDQMDAMEGDLEELGFTGVDISTVETNDGYDLVFKIEKM